MPPSLRFDEGSVYPPQPLEESVRLGSSAERNTIQWEAFGLFMAQGDQQLGWIDAPFMPHLKLAPTAGGWDPLPVNPRHRGMKGASIRPGVHARAMQELIAISGQLLGGARRCSLISPGPRLSLR